MAFQSPRLPLDEQRANTLTHWLGEWLGYPAKLGRSASNVAASSSSYRTRCSCSPELKSLFGKPATVRGRERLLYDNFRKNGLLILVAWEMSRVLLIVRRKLQWRAGVWRVARFLPTVVLLETTIP